MMTWMVAIVLILFYFLGTYAFHQTRVSRALPYVVVGILIVDLLLARVFRSRKSLPTSDSD